MVAGATGIDLFLLVVDAAEGARPQTHEHLAILRLLGIEPRRRRDHEGRRRRRGDAARSRSRRRTSSCPELRSSRRAHAPATGSPELVEALRGGPPTGSSDGSPLAPTRLFVDRSFSLRGHRHRRDRARSGPGRSARADELVGRAARASGTGTQRPGARPPGRARRRRSAGRRVAARGRSHAASAEGTRSSSPARYPTSYRLDVAARGARAELARPRPGARPSRHRRALRASRPRRRALRTAPARPPRRSRRAGDRVVLRDRTTVGGGVVLDPAPPRRHERRAPRPARARRSGVDRPRGARPRLPRAARPRRAGSGALLLGPASSTRVSRRPSSSATSTRHRNGSTSWRDARRGSGSPTGRGRARSIRASRSPSSCRRDPWAQAALAMLPLERRGAKAYAPGASAHLGDRAAAAAALEAELAASGFTPLKAEDRELAVFLESEGRLVRLGDGLVIGASRPTTRRAPDARRRVRGEQARSRSPASATGSASAAGRPRSCSSASTPTA